MRTGVRGSVVVARVPARERAGLCKPNNWQGLPIYLAAHRSAAIWVGLPSVQGEPASTSGGPPPARRSALLLLPLLREPRIPCSNQPVPLVHVGGLGFAVKGVLHHALQGRRQVCRGQGGQGAVSGQTAATA